jgi:Cd2+/Zn2+-exporting ATPase
MNFQELLKNKQFRLLLLSLLIILPLELLSFYSFHFPLWFELPFFLILIFFIGRNVFKDGLQSLLHLNFSNINLLMTVAVLGALYVQQFEEAAIIVVLFALGETLQDIGMEKSQSALEELVKKAPKSATVKGKEEKVAIEQIILDAVLIIKPGDQIPLDGVVVKGESLIDESVITGEHLPKNKNLGDMVFAGTINGSGYLEMKVTKTAKDTTLAKIIDLTYSSSEKKSRSQQFIEQFAVYYTPTILVIALLLVIIPVFFLHQPFTRWFTEALTLLIISCPCALVISTPIAVFSALGNASKRGVLIKGGRFIEEMGKIKAIAFDKTRTLTKGEPIVSDVIAFNGYSKEDVLACASGLETFSEHPIARSVEKKLEELHLPKHEFKDFSAVSGKGVKGNCLVCYDRHHCLGNLAFLKAEHKVQQEVIEKVAEFEKQGKTAIVMSDDKQVEGVISITDEIRPESKQMINTLLQLHIRPIILTGDNESSAQFVAKILGIAEVKASLLPEEKVAALKTLIKEYHHVAMIGDGVNDAPSLASSSVGIAMGAVGSDVAIENADIALMNDNIGVIPFLILLGKESNRTIRVNIFSAVGVKLVFLILAIIGYSNLTFAIFADVGVTILVVLNGLRLYSYKSGYLMS